MEESWQPRPHRWVRWVGALLLVTGVLALPACSGKEESPLVMGQVIGGKVTYKGEPVPYGYVLMYSLGKSRDNKTGAFIPTGIGEIRDGKYQVPNAPAGPVMVCVATDPDTDPQDFMRPARLGGFDPEAGLAGGPRKDPPGGPKGGPRKGPPGGPKGDPSKGPPGGPPMGFPGGMPGAIPKGPPAPPHVEFIGDLKFGPPGGFPDGFKGPPSNPLTAKLSDAQKSTLRAIHAKYGTLGKSPLSIVVKEGEQTFDLKLK